jgi:hypothetical protein
MGRSPLFGETRRDMPGETGTSERKDMKARALLFLNRALKGLEEQRKFQSQLGAAEAGLSYSQRRALVEASEQKVSETQSEYEALQWAYQKIQELPDD